MKVKTKYFLQVFCLALVMAPVTVKADTDSLTSLFRSRAFSGSMETISKLNWVGWLMSGIITVFCLVGLFLTVFRIMTSLMYLSGRNVFDKIHEIKSSNQGEFFGLKSLVSSAIHGSGNMGSGIDTFIYFFLGLLPDVKMYSDFADGKEMRGVGPDTTVTEYILKTSIPTIMMIFFLSIGFSGTLWQMFGTVVDAMAVAAERVADSHLDTCVRRLLNADSYYKFGFGDDGTKWGALQDRMATSIYNAVLSKSDGTINGDNSLLLGKVIGEEFTGKGRFTRKNIAKICGIDTDPLSDSEAKNVEYNVVVNTIADPIDTNSNDAAEIASSSKTQELSHDQVIPMKDFLTAMHNKTKGSNSVVQENDNLNLYVHVYMYRKSSAIKGNYFSSKNKGKSDVEDNGSLANQNGIKNNSNSNNKND